MPTYSPYQQWLADNGMAQSSNPNFVVGTGGYAPTNGLTGALPGNNFMSADAALKRYQNETSVSGGGGDGSASAGNPFGGAPTMNMANAFGAAPTLNTSNRFEAGLGDAEGRLRNLLDNPDSINQSAAYKFRVKQGEEAINRQLGAKGMLNSGNRLMELTKYGQDMGSQEYDAQAGRLGNLLGNYSQSWLGDKNANTNQFTAQSNAWLGGERANTDRFSAQSGAWNNAQGNADRTRLGYAEIAGANSRASMGGGGSARLSSLAPSYFNAGGIGGSNPVDWNAFDTQMTNRRTALDRY